MRMVFNGKSYSIDPKRAKFCRDTVNKEVEAMKAFCDSHNDPTLFITYLIIKKFLTDQLLKSIDDDTVAHFLKQIRDSSVRE